MLILRGATMVLGGVTLVLVLFLVAPVLALLEPKSTARFMEDVGDEVVDMVRGQFK